MTVPQQFVDSALVGIDAGILYPVAVLEQMGLSAYWLRRAKRNGLHIRQLGRRQFVLGQDIIEFAAKPQQTDVPSKSPSVVR